MRSEMFPFLVVLFLSSEHVRWPFNAHDIWSTLSWLMGVRAGSLRKARNSEVKVGETCSSCYLFLKWYCHVTSLDTVTWLACRDVITAANCVFQIHRFLGFLVCFWLYKARFYPKTLRKRVCSRLRPESPLERNVNLPIWGYVCTFWSVQINNFY